MPTIFFSYSHADEVFRDQLEVHLSALKRQKVIESWHDRKIIAGSVIAGSVIDDAIDRHLNEADVILLLVSPDFIASDYCYDKEVRRATERHAEGTARVIPVILRPCDWHTLPFGKLLAAPKDGRAITLWPNRDEALLHVVKSIRAALCDLVVPSAASVASELTPPVTLETETPTEVHSRSSVEVVPKRGTSEISLARLPSIGIDMGTKTTRIYIEGRGIVLSEPTTVAVAKSTGKVIAAGNEVLNLLSSDDSAGIKVGDYVVIHPVKESVISEPDAAFQMLRHLLGKVGVQGTARTVFSVSAVATTANHQVLYYVAKRANLGKIEFVERTLLAALADGPQRGTVRGSMVVDIGAGTTDVAIIKGSRVLYSCAVRAGGNQINEAVTKFIRRTYMRIIGESSAELIKSQIGTAWPLNEKLTVDIKARNLIEGGVETMTMTDSDVRGVIQECVAPIISEILETCHRVSSTYFAGDAEDQILLSGGGAALRGIDRAIQARIPARVTIQKDPLSGVASAFGPFLNGELQSKPWVYRPSKGDRSLHR